MKISILGYGTFGGALGSHLVLKGHKIIKEKIEVDTEVVIVAVPSYAVTDVLIAHKDEINTQKIIICSKGFDKSGDLFSNILEKEFPNNQIYFLYGPTLADELESGVLSVFVLAGGEGREKLKKEIESEKIRIVLSSDVIGVQVSAALKNTVGIFLGIIEGAGMGQNTQGFIYSMGLQQIRNIGVSLGANPDTFLGFACAGDLFVKSRSRNIGVEIGRGKDPKKLLDEITFPKEGINSLENILKMESRIKTDIFFFKIINSVIFGELTAEDGVRKIAEMI